MPNIFAYLALISWPFISVIFYKKMPVVNATLWTIVGGFLLLPVKVEIDFPLVPAFDKESITAIAALIGIKYIKKIKITLLPKRGIERGLVILFIMVPFFTMLNNQEAINGIPGLTLHDTLSTIINQFIRLIPFIIGMQLIKTRDDQLLIFKFIVAAAALYSIPMILEVVTSPIMHIWAYGFFPNDAMGQQIRFGGYRPVVFLGHGLIVAIFIAVALGSSVILAKEKIKTFKMPAVVVLIYFCFLLFLCKTVGAFLLGTVLLITISFFSTKVIKKIALIIAFIIILYPLLSMFDLFPHIILRKLAESFDASRGESLGFRFYQEYILLEHAQKKFFFGWGGWGRNRVWGSVTDGYWIIIFGIYGFFGFISIFGLPVISIWKSIKASSLLKDKNEQWLLVSHALIVATIMVDQLPNDSMAAWQMLLIGGLLGRANNIKKYSN